MTSELASILPPSLAPFAPGLAFAPPSGDWRPARTFRSRAVLAETLATFGRPFGRADERALLSYWTQFYFATLIIPTLASVLCLRRAWPVALDVVDFRLDGAGQVGSFRLSGRASGQAHTLGLAPLIAGHLDPLIRACGDYNGVSPRTLWCNAGTMFDYALQELAAAGTLQLEAPWVAALLGEAEAAAHKPRDLLFRPYRPKSSEAVRQRKICCLRYKLPGVSCCGDLCPLSRPATQAVASRPEADA